MKDLDDLVVPFKTWKSFKALTVIEEDIQPLFYPIWEMIWDKN